jgi:hypothetical protein
VTDRQIMERSVSAEASTLGRPSWPDGRRFAFTIVDDTDKATLANVAPAYEFLLDHGFRITKTVWPLAPIRAATLGGMSLEGDEAYRTWVLRLSERGTEIGMHGVADHACSREEIIRGFDYYHSVLGADPRVYVNHVSQAESPYWGPARLDGFAALTYRALLAAGQVKRRLVSRKKPDGSKPARARRADIEFRGHVPGSSNYWGDICRERVTYVRNFTFDGIDTLAADPLMPYHDSRRPMVPFWFSASNGSRLSSLCELLREDRQDALAAAGGACIVYTHFAFGFVEDGRVRPEFVRVMKRLASLGGWYVPVSTLLDHLRTQPGWSPEVDRRQFRRVQWRWLASKVRIGTA